MLVAFGSSEAHAARFRRPVNLGTAGTFAILTKSGTTNVPTSAVVGDVGTSPITGAAIGLTCGEVAGRIYSVDAAGPAPCTVIAANFLGAAVLAMETAYDDAAGRVGPDFTELGAGEIGGLTLAPGLYKWGTSLLISTNVTLSGGPDDVWIFQVAGTLNQASSTRVNLTGGARSKNIFWQVAGAVTIDTGAHFEGVVLAKTQIAVKTGASANGRLFAQTAVTLQSNAITQPPASAAPSVINMYRLYAENMTSEHLYTTDLNEYNTLGAGYNSQTRVGWVREGIAFKVLSTDGAYNGATGIPFYRLYNSILRQHHWTTDANEVEVLSGSTSWNLEGVVGYILPEPTGATGVTRLYRLWDRGALHLWTIDANERDFLSNQAGWSYEGIVGNVIP